MKTFLSALYLILAPLTATLAFGLGPLFEARMDFGAGDGPRSVLCADLDNDNHLDLAVANWRSDNVSILKNNGDGTYQTAVN